MWCTPIKEQPETCARAIGLWSSVLSPGRMRMMRTPMYEPDKNDIAFNHRLDVVTRRGGIDIVGFSDLNPLEIKVKGWNPPPGWSRTTVHIELPHPLPAR